MCFCGSYTGNIYIFIICLSVLLKEESHFTAEWKQKDKAVLWHMSPLYLDLMHTLSHSILYHR